MYCPTERNRHGYVLLQKMNLQGRQVGPRFFQFVLLAEAAGWRSPERKNDLVEHKTTPRRWFLNRRDLRCTAQLRETVTDMFDCRKWIFRVVKLGSVSSWHSWWKQTEPLTSSNYPGVDKPTGKQKNDLVAHESTLRPWFLNGVDLRCTVQWYF